MLSVLAMLSAQFMLFRLAPSILALPLQLDLPTLFNSALLNSTTLSIINTRLRDETPCFDPRPDREPTNYRDCEAAILEMNLKRDQDQYIFGRGSHATYKLPRTFHSGTCAVNLDMVYEEQTDRLTLPEIQGAAFAMANECTSGTVFNRGGSVAVGPKKVLYVTILGIAV